MAVLEGSIALVCILVLCLYFFRSQPRGLPPGPIAWPIVGSMFSLKQPLHKHFAKLGAKYGPIMHFKLGAARIIVVNNSHVAEELFRNHDLEFASRPSSRFWEIISLGHKDIAFSDLSEHSNALRKAVLHRFFSPSKLNETASTRESELKSMVLCILASSREGSEIDVRKFMGEYNTNLMWVLLFGKKPATAGKIMEMTYQVMNMIQMFNIGEVFPVLEGLDLQGLYKNTRKLLTVLTDLLTQTLQDTREVNGWRNGILDGSMPESSVVPLLTDMMLAGLESTQIAVEWAMAEILNNATIMKKVQQELTDVVGLTRLVQESDLSQLPYLQAIVKETLRLHPPGPIAIPHVNREPATLSGYKIPPNSRVLINIWAICRDPTYWEAPDVFKPDRFINNSNISLAGKNFDVIPFSSGRRMCPGYPLAMRSAPLSLATLLHSFEWTTVSHLSLEEDPVPSVTVKLASRLIAHVQPRLIMESVYM